tara:strand:+ start:21627 stop:21899 length:273 start_codon:yes stop_codon:yes gene_type:complete
MNQELELIQENSEPSKEDVERIKNRLISIGLNSVISSYSSEEKQVAEDFLQLKLSDVAPCWSFLSPTVKIRLIDLHEEEFLTWLSSARNK